jgi:hypothetical protein
MEKVMVNFRAPFAGCLLSLAASAAVSIALIKPNRHAAQTWRICAALRTDGTCSGEHGVGRGKIRYLAQRARAGRRSHGCHKKGARPVENPQS